MPNHSTQIFDELQAISQYLDRQRNVRDCRRLFAWLASGNFGAQLQHGRVQAEQRSPHRTNRPATKKKIACKWHHCGWFIGNSSCGPRTRTSWSARHQIQPVWQSILDHLQQQLPPDIFATWIADTILLALDDQMVVGTPQVFARDVLQSKYLPVLHQVLQRVLDRTNHSGRLRFGPMLKLSPDDDYFVCR
ncbi:MAG: hypothetical protein CYG59_16330 [Chloroflexi bacterium]|nr:MAG: hypothetical protein CYG59_16330 [Chloroflexota bacterium]